MFLEYDWTFDAYRSHLGGAFPAIEHSFATLAVARHALRLVGLRLGAKTDPRAWRIEFMDPVAERADFSRLGSWANGNRERMVVRVKTTIDSPSGKRGTPVRNSCERAMGRLLEAS